MAPVVGKTYVGPFGRIYRVDSIEDPDGYPLVVIRAAGPGQGSIRFPLNQAAKWLEPIDQSGQDAIGAAENAE